ncbi:MAG: hypothetical protein JXB38_05180 [Anaerolineales bacterium]|nr:hypothetical protein [Anaerolineales bacterium]
MPPHPHRYKPNDKFNWLVMIVITVAFGLNNAAVISWQTVEMLLVVTLVPMIGYLAFLSWRAYRDGQTRNVVINVILIFLFIGALYAGFFAF